MMVKTGSRGIIFAIETGGHYWRNLAYFLDEQGVSFRIINPFTLRRIREAKDIFPARKTFGLIWHELTPSLVADRQGRSLLKPHH